MVYIIQTRLIQFVCVSGIISCKQCCYCTLLHNTSYFMDCTGSVHEQVAIYQYKFFPPSLERHPEQLFYVGSQPIGQITLEQKASVVLSI